MNWRAGIYGRVSTEHEEQQESIKVQKDALMQFARENMINVSGCYFDEGYTGTNFERPELSRLKNDIEKGIINMVITKDLSRIGRNNTMTLLFLDYLSEKNVRLIALSDDYDTLKDQDDLIGIKTWVNERYSRELSKKIRFALKHKKRNGEYLAAFAPYGYKKSSDTKNKLEVDYYAAGIVKEIFKLYIEGNGFAKIADILESRGVLNPSRYGCYGRKSEKWDWSTIKRIITNPVYTGNSVQQRYSKKSYKSKSIIKTPQSEWIEVKNTHEPIISREIFETAGKILNKRKITYSYRNGPGHPHLFSSFLYCHECGSPLYYKRDKSNNGVYRCGSYIKHGRKYCSSHFISEKELKEAVRSEITSIIVKNIDYEMLFNDIVYTHISMRQGDYEKKLDYLLKEIKKNECKLETLYRDRLNGLIDKKLFVRMKNELEALIKEQVEQKEIYSNKILKHSSGQVDSIFYENKIAGILSMKREIDRYMLEKFIKRIEVCENGDLFLKFNFFL